uniref:HAT C-terminal dimerisation domain-containing protein n=1 Tax=Phlebotomus papatasi TaxID=29031 RepID=A0A1B0DRC2_PHLPP
MKFLIDVGEKNGINKSDLLLDFVNYKSKQDIFEPPFVWEVLKDVSPAAWWSACFPKVPLSLLAQKILQAPPTSSACERSFSVQNDTHSKKRNRLKNEKVDKLMIIKCDLQSNAREACSSSPNKRKICQNATATLENYSSDSDSDIQLTGQSTTTHPDEDYYHTNQHSTYPEEEEIIDYLDYSEEDHTYTDTSSAHPVEEEVI